MQPGIVKYCLKTILNNTFLKKDNHLEITQKYVFVKFVFNKC